MGMFQGDIRLKSIVELGLEDIKKNPFLMSDILGDCIATPYLAERYGNQIANCLQWLENNRINIYMSERDDQIDFPAVTIELGEPTEKPEMKTMGDISTSTENFIPNKINRPIPYVVAPQSGSYDSTSGLFNFSGTVNLTTVAPDMVLVDPATGTGYKVLSVDQNGISLGPNLTLGALTYGVIPQYQIYQAKIGHTFFAESYKIGCHGVDQQTALWLHSIVSYSLLRYRAALLEAGGFAETVIKSSPLMINMSDSGEAQAIWFREITISGQTESTWIMAPHRFIETVNFKDPNQPQGYYGGIKIASNLDSQDNLSDVNWQTVKDTQEYPDFMAGEE